MLPTENYPLPGPALFDQPIVGIPYAQLIGNCSLGHHPGHGEVPESHRSMFVERFVKRSIVISLRRALEWAS